MVGIGGAVWATTPLPGDLKAEAYSIFANVLPEDKFSLVKALQKDGHIVGMCGDGANDAPALRQAQMGIAVSTATDVAKSAAGIVLTKPGLAGIVAAIKEGRTTFQRILTYTLRSVTHKMVQVMFLGAGLLITGHAILTPDVDGVDDDHRRLSFDDLIDPTTYARLQNPISGISAISRLSASPWDLADLAFCTACLAVGKFALELDTEALRTMAVVTLVFSGPSGLLRCAREGAHLEFASGPVGSSCRPSSIYRFSVFCPPTAFSWRLYPYQLSLAYSSRRRLCVCPGRREVGLVQPTGGLVTPCPQPPSLRPRNLCFESKQMICPRSADVEGAIWRLGGPPGRLGRCCIKILA